MFWGNVVAVLPSCRSASPWRSAAARIRLDSAEGIRNVMASASSGGVLVLVIGILMMAGEFRHSTATSTFLITPDRAPRDRREARAAGPRRRRRRRSVASLLTLAIALPWLASRGRRDLGVHAGDDRRVLLGGIAATVLGAVVGVGFGAMVRNQTPAITIALVWTQVVEGMLVGFVPGVGKLDARRRGQRAGRRRRHRTAGCCRWAPPPCCSPPTAWPSRPRARRPSPGGTSHERAQCPHGRSRS